MSGHVVSKEGNCTKCNRSEIMVSWHPATRSWFCRDCWPALNEPKQERRESQIPTLRELQRLRDHLYGIRVEDDPHHLSAFVAICPEHGLLDGDLSLVAARRLRDNHELTHPI